MTPLDRAQRITERLPGPRERPVPIGHGIDHTAFAAGPYIVRVVTHLDDTATDAVAREVELLTYLQTRLPVALPHPSTVHPDLGGFAYLRLPGRPLLDTVLTDTTRLTDDIGVVLRAMADIDTAAISDLISPDPYPLDVWRDEVVTAALEVSGALTTLEQDLIRTFATAPLPREQGTVALCHNDLGAEHLLVDEASGALVGVLDWSDAAAADPCRDLGRLCRDLGPEALDRVLTQAQLPSSSVDADRIRLHARLATLEDLHHGITTGDPRYTEAARRALTTLFTPPPGGPAGQDGLGSS